MTNNHNLNNVLASNIKTRTTERKLHQKTQKSGIKRIEGTLADKEVYFLKMLKPRSSFIILSFGFPFCINYFFMYIFFSRS